MGAEMPRRRKDGLTAREVAARTGVSIRTVRRLVAEPRENFLNRAAERRSKVAELRKQGIKYVDIAAQTGLSIGAVSRLIHDAKRYGELEPQQQAAG